MFDMVIGTAANNLAKAGWTTLRFNFRGVGASQGNHEGGPAETADVVAAAAYLKDSGFSRILVAGYSFGAWVSLLAWDKLEPLGVEPMILIAPPTARMDFNPISANARVGLAICGENDDIAPPDKTGEMLMRLADPIEPSIVHGADHFFFEGSDEFSRIWDGYLESIAAT